MRNFFGLVGLLLGSMSLSAVAADEADCLDPETDYLAMDFMAFDQTMSEGWRAVANKKHCRAEAADLIHRYATQKDGVSDGMLSTLRWHEGQMRAEAGQNKRAVALFKQTYKPQDKDRMGWNYYVAATIAFLEQDKAALLKSRAQLAALEKPADMDFKDADGNPVDIPWPPNLHVVDRFIACFGNSYSNAYGDCEAGNAH
ncbi:MAG: hypothetical protein CMF12_13260 [Idiomarina sp.]|uniref:hypothetical protein n=1 Tax=Idiomarina sp. TaxID=1874361 RepID=UPI000C56D0A7|nr:hypothetical protein [Idiomarina sp.]MBT43476.1 hypothetical protein [Idiomarina sp.]